MTGTPVGQRLVWVAHLEDGEVLEEYTPEGVETRFEDLDKERLRRFALVDGHRRHRPPVAVLDCRTGEVFVQGGRLGFRLDGVPLTGRAGVDYRDVVQWKRAHTSWSPLGGSTGNVVDAHGIGFRAELLDGWVQVVLVLPVNGEEPSIEAEVHLPGFREGPLEVLLDGEPVRGPGELAAALGAQVQLHASLNGHRREG